MFEPPPPSRIFMRLSASSRLGLAFGHGGSGTDKTMISLQQREHHDITRHDAYRSWLISRNEPPIILRSNAIPWKRLRGLVRRAASQVMCFFAIIRVSVVAHKMRRVRGAQARLDGVKRRGRGV
jgi:hypothetical protein